MKKLLQSLSVLILSSVFMFNAHAENMTKLDHLDVHYIAFGATFLTPKIALLISQYSTTPLKVNRLKM